MIERLAAGLAEGAPDPTLAEELDHFELQLQGLHEQFRLELCSQDLTPDEDDIAADVADAFVEVGAHLPALRHAAAIGDIDAMSAETPPLVAALRGLSSGFEKLRAAEQARPVLSPVPAVNAALRVAHAVREERLDFEALEARLTPMIATLDSVCAQIEGAPPADAEMLARVRAHRDAVEALCTCARNEALEGLDAGMRAVAETAQALYDAQMNRQTVSTNVSEHVCPSCGTSQLPGAPSCAACGGHLPQHGSDANAEGGLPAYAEQITNTAARLLAGEPCLELFQPQVAALRQHTRQALALLEKIATLPPDTPERERRACEEGQALVEDGLEQMFEAVELFETVCQGGDAWTLEQGIDRMRTAIAQLCTLPEVWDRLRDG